MLKDGTPLAARRIIEALSATMIVHYKGEEVGEYVDHSTRLSAAEALLSRLYGRPSQALTVDLEQRQTRQFDVSRLTREELAALDVLHQANARLLAEADAGAPGVAQGAIEAPSEGQDRGTPPSGNGGDNGNGL